MLTFRPWEGSLSRQAWGGLVRTLRLGPGHGRLTAFPASASLTLIILRVADLAATLLDGIFEHPAWLFLSGYC
jgi:hypothetical protein